MEFIFAVFVAYACFNLFKLGRDASSQQDNTALAFLLITYFEDRGRDRALRPDITWKQFKYVASRPGMLTKHEIKSLERCMKMIITDVKNPNYLYANKLLDKFFARLEILEDL